MDAAAVAVGMSWMWTLAFGHHEDRTPISEEAAMAAASQKTVPFSPRIR
jgi:hypothetical protein